MDNRIKEWRQRRGLSAQALAAKLGTGRSTIVKLERGERTLSLDWMQRIAKELNLATAQLLSSDAAFPVEQNLVSAPLLDWDQAGEYAGIVPHRHPVSPREKADFVPYPRDSIIALSVEGYEMNRVAPAGSTIYVDFQDKTLVDGKFYVVTYKDQIVFRRYRDRPPRLEPFSTIPDIEMIFDGVQEAAVVGRVVRVSIPLE